MNTDGVLVLALGNELLRDDAVALHAARMLRYCVPEHVRIIESAEAGFALLEHMNGTKRLLILDAIHTRRCASGTILPFLESDFNPLESPSPHYAGIPDLRVLAERIGVPFPSIVRILTMEVEDPLTIKEELTPSVSAALPGYVSAAAAIVNDWMAEDSEIPERD